MKQLIALLMILGITSCGVYRPSVKDLEKNGFKGRITSNLGGVDFYKKDLTDPVYTEIYYHPRLNVWTVYGQWENNYLGSSFEFYVRNKKDYKSMMDEIKSMSNPNTQKNVERKRKRAD